MKNQLLQAYLVELLGTFGVVLIGAGVVCVNSMTLPAGQEAGKTAVFGHQPGLVGMALAQGFALTVALAVTLRIAGGYLNPAIAIMLWVFNRMSSRRAAWLIGAQLLGGVLAGGVIYFTFHENVLETAQMGAPHLNQLAYPDEPSEVADSEGKSVSLSTFRWWRLMSGALIELLLTFFLVFAIFGSIRSKEHWTRLEEKRVKEVDRETGEFRSVDTRLAALVAGLTQAACVLFAFPLTGAALNPARWFGSAFWEWAVFRRPAPFAEMFVYIAGPVIGALLAGLVFFKVMGAPASLEKEQVKSKK